MPSIYASFAAVLALKSGRAVRFIPGREEIIEYGAKKPEIIIWRKSAVDEKGKILAEKVTINANLGAYPLFTDEILSQLIIGAAGSYTIPNLKITCRGIITSEPPMNVFNGLGLSAGVFLLKLIYRELRRSIKGILLSGDFNICPGENVSTDGWNRKRLQRKSTAGPCTGAFRFY